MQGRPPLAPIVLSIISTFVTPAYITPVGTLVVVKPLYHTPMSRLASFRGPSTPSSQPVASSPQPSFPPFNTHRTPKKSKQNRQGFTTPPPTTPSCPNRDRRDRRDSGFIQFPRRRRSLSQQGENDAKGKIQVAVRGPGDMLKEARWILLEIRGCAKQWNELVNEGSRHAKEIVDSRTRIE